MSAEENVKNIVAAPLYAIMVFRFCCTLCQYAELPVMFPTYLDSFVINDLEVLFFAIFCNSSNVRCASPGFCFKKTLDCCKVRFLWIKFKAQ